MLTNLHVKDMAIIREAELEFGSHLNILTGETGAGKSILIGSVSLALGGKAGKDVIREGAPYALVELSFQTRDPGIQQWFEENELPFEDGTLVFSRKIYPNRSVNRINGETVPLSLLRQASGYLLDIHGQHEHQSLLHREKHREIVDRFGRCQEQAARMKEAYRAWKEARKELAEHTISEEDRQRDCAFCEYEEQEILNAHVRRGEEEELTSRHRKLANMSQIESGMAEVYRCTGEGETSAGEQISRALRSLSQIAEYDAPLQDFTEQLLQVEDILGECNRNMADYQMNLEFDHEALHETEERLDEIRRLEEKYGGSYDSMMAHLAKIQEKIQRYREYDQFLASLQEKERTARSDAVQEADRLTSLREAAARDLAPKIVQSLRDLNFLQADFSISCTKKDAIGPDGQDEIEFLIATNPGEQKRPLTAVASGGELSRIMLAIKSVLAQEDAIDTLIFDEIDTGISGVTAQKVAKRMQEISNVHQVICITHLQQIAAQADTHFLIEKHAAGDGTEVEIRLLSPEESVEELARMLGGENRSAAIYETARELKRQAIAERG